MKRIKLILAILLCVCIMIPLASCGGTEQPASTETTANKTGSSAAAATKTTASETTEASQTAATTEPFEKFDADGKYIPHNYDTVKAMKLTQWDVSEAELFVSGGVQKSEPAFKVAADRAMRNIAEDGYNTVLVQMRPFSDSFYPSKYYPISTFVSGSYAIQELKYDPITTIVEKAHKYGLSIHGWINPMRCMTVSEIEKITTESAVTKWYKEMGKEDSPYSQYMFIETDAGGTTRLYLNPAYEEVRALIINGVREICDNYNVDGIFMDDYFYPQSVLNKKEIDSLAYEDRTDDSTNVFRFRCNNINTLVKGIYQTVKDADPALIYGISPNGEIRTAYNEECADIYTWCKEDGYVDVMYPQFYYGMIHKTSSVPSLLLEWDNAMKNDNIRLVPVLTLHKAGKNDQWAVSEDGKKEWIDHNDVLLEELTYLMTNSDRKVDGIGFFCYQFFHLSENNSAAVRKEIEGFSFIIHEFEQYNGKTPGDLKSGYSAHGVDLDAKMSEWNDTLRSAGKDILF